MSKSLPQKSMHTMVRRPQRWDEPLFENMPESMVEYIMGSIHFKLMESSNFAKQIALEDIIRNDCQILTFETHDSIVSAGAYLNSVYIVMSGCAAMFSEDANNRVVPAKRNRPTVWTSFMQWLRKPNSSEVRAGDDALPTPQSSTDLVRQTSSGSGRLSDLKRVYVGDVPSTARELVGGDIFGESAVLGRNEMRHSVVAKSPTIVLEIRWQGLRELRKREPNFKKFVDKLYRQRGLYDYLRAHPLFASVDEIEIRALAREALFEIHGEFEWHQAFKKASKKKREDKSYDEVIESEILIAKEGHYPDGLLLIRNGFARLSRKINHGHYTIGHLSAGDVFGLEELWRSSRNVNQMVLSCSLRALGYTDVIRIPTHWLEKNLINNGNERVQASLAKCLGANISLSSKLSPEFSSPRNQVDRKITEFVVEHHFVNGTEAMMIDLERCVRCDDCVTACANAHNNNPRFNRHGPKSGRYMIANACMHCEDPVCMIGCPTGAIHRAEDGVVSINDSTCVGCSTCANSCPYDNIRMVSVRDENDQLLVDANSKAILKATKCDLCSTVAGGPACERACSHDALVRMDLKDGVKLADWLNRK